MQQIDRQTDKWTDGKSDIQRCVPYLKRKSRDHKQISFRYFKNYSVDEYKKALGKVTFPNYERYHNINKAYNNFFQKLIEVVNNIAPFKTARIKNTSSEWFDKEIAKKLSIRYNCLKNSN